MRPDSVESIEVLVAGAYRSAYVTEPAARAHRHHSWLTRDLALVPRREKVNGRGMAPRAAAWD